MIIKSKTISTSNFKKFGSVVTLPSGKPTSEAADYKFWADIADYNINGETEIGICVVYRQKENKITGMERHLRTPEILIPIDGAFVLPLLLEGDSENRTEAFKVNIGEAVKINDAVWHGACLPANKEESSYFVIFRKGTPHEDIEKKNISPLEISM
ncbi:MAG TPA: ureidoglycolate lyase [Ignavibacteriaceae bacterium]|nr:ureidoglycolate lyase [Ignavibacteriaceae bacterium]